jgi:BirA family biotin operon repressor/biotin-[acetyl-CoA-carboxylase] ligase
VVSEKGSIIHWPAEALWQELSPYLPGFSVEILPSIDSTNTELMRRARIGQTDPVLLVAERQTAGRGRLGRPWHSDHKQLQGLTFSLGLSMGRLDLSGLSLAVGLSLASSLHPDLKLKWPNDLWWQNRKLGGILIETVSVLESRYLVIGVGLNLTQPEVSGLRTPAAWVEELDPALDAPAVLARVLAPLVQTVQAFEDQGFAPYQSAFLKRDALAGRELRLSDGTRGRAAGVDARGALLVQTPTGVKSIDSAEVSVVSNV